MGKEFVPYQESLELRELGFNEPCLAFWDAYNGDTHLFFKQRCDYHWLFKLFGQKPKPVLEISNWEIEYLEGDGTVLAPTFSQAFRWFREKHNLNAAIYPIKQHWECDIRHTNKDVNSSVFSWDEEFTYEEAELACLRKLIEIVKNEKNI